MSGFAEVQVAETLPRLPLDGSIDLTYRCNFNCRHCWLRIPPDSRERRRELSLDDIKVIVDEARGMGCRRWSISGGEPMLRPDFAEIFDYITRKSASCSINTNGSRITPKIARLLKRSGAKMVAVYGATADVHDHITRVPGSFEAAMRGFTYLKEAGAGFVVQLIPMRDNYYQFDEMVRLAESLSRHWRIGAAWLFLSASGDSKRNQEIRRQRLGPRDVVDLDKPDLSYEEWMNECHGQRSCDHARDDRLFASCIDARREFHIDPYGQMSACAFIKDPALRYNLTKGNFEQCWEEFIPSLADTIRGGKEYVHNCGACELRSDCRWCPVYGYLEHRRFSAKVEYLCAAARENRKFKEAWQVQHRRYYDIGGITIRVEADLPITDHTFHPTLKRFQVHGPTEDMITIRHHFDLPEHDDRDFGKEVYRKAPWAVYRNGNSWIYLGFSCDDENENPHRVAVFSRDHRAATVYSPNGDSFREGGLRSLSLMPSDQILVARTLADSGGCCFRSSGVILDGDGLLLVGGFEAGRSDMIEMLKDQAEILSDATVIVRKHHEGFRVYSTWSHGDVTEESPSSAPLRTILFLKNAERNRLIRLDGGREIAQRLTACLVRPLVTMDWWEKVLSLVGDLSAGVPCYVLEFNRSGRAVNLLKRL